MPERTVALVPLRALGTGKSRLSLRLTPEQRATLSRAMFEDVVTALARSQVDEVVVAAGDEQAGALARHLGVRARVDPPGAGSLDEVIAAIVDDASLVRPDDALLVVTADLPELRARHVDALLDLEARVAIAPTHDGGTGALLRRPATVVSTAYGPGSASRHQQLAEAAQVACHLADLPGFEHDVDLWSDLVRLSPDQVGPRTAEVLPELLTAA